MLTQRIPSLCNLFAHCNSRSTLRPLLRLYSLRYPLQSNLLHLPVVGRLHASTNLGFARYLSNKAPKIVLPKRENEGYFEPREGRVFDGDTTIVGGRYRGPERSNLIPLTEKPKGRYYHFYHSDYDAPQKGSVVTLVVLGLGLALFCFGWLHQGLEYLDNSLHEKYHGQDTNNPQKPMPPNSRGIIKADCSTVAEAHASEEEEEEGPKKQRIGFRDRKIMAYEDRIRQYSTPDKIFRYFATLRSDDSGEIFMTPEDFVRSITPGQLQPEGLGLDSFKKYDHKVDQLNLHIPKNSVFYRLGDQAIISFSDYVFLLSVLATPQRQFEIAFRMFDLNGDGELDLEEFNVVRNVIRDTTAIGKRHRDHAVTGNTLQRDMNSALTTYFFGPKGDKKLSVAKFLEFQALLQKEILQLEFDRYDPVDGKIRELDFADIVLCYAGYSENKKKKMKRRVKKKFSGEDSKGITFEEHRGFAELLRNISDVDTALTFYHLAGAAIDEETLKHVTRSVASVTLSDHVVNVIFSLFDENEDGHLSNKEFISVMKQRQMRGLDHPMDTGFVRLLSACWKCGKEQLKVSTAPTDE